MMFRSRLAITIVVSVLLAMIGRMGGLDWLGSDVVRGLMILCLMLAIVMGVFLFISIGIAFVLSAILDACMGRPSSSSQPLPTETLRDG